MLRLGVGELLLERLLLRGEREDVVGLRVRGVDVVLQAPRLQDPGVELGPVCAAYFADLFLRRDSRCQHSDDSREGGLGQ